MAFSSILPLERIAAGQIVKFVLAEGRMEARHMKQMAEPQLQREPPAFGRAEPLRITQEQIGAYLEILRERGCTPDTIKSYRRNLNQFFAFLRGGRELTRDSVADWREEMLSRGYMPRTVNNRLSAANGLLGYLNLREYQAPAQIKLEEDDEIQPELTRNEYLRLLSAARALNRERVYLLVKTFAVLGLSIQQLSRLTAEAVGRGRIPLGSGQPGVDIPQCLRTELAAYIRREGICRGPVFITHSGKPISRTGVTACIQQLARDARVPPEKCNPRCLRRLCQSTKESIRRNLSLLVEQAYGRLLEEEQAAVGWTEDRF